MGPVPKARQGKARQGVDEHAHAEHLVDGGSECLPGSDGPAHAGIGGAARSAECGSSSDAVGSGCTGVHVGERMEPQAGKRIRHRRGQNKQSAGTRQYRAHADAESS